MWSMFVVFSQTYPMFYFTMIPLCWHKSVTLLLVYYTQNFVGNSRLNHNNDYTSIQLIEL